MSRRQRRNKDSDSDATEIDENEGPAPPRNTASSKKEEEKPIVMTDPPLELYDDLFEFLDDVTDSYFTFRPRAGDARWRALVDTAQGRFASDVWPRVVRRVQEAWYATHKWLNRNLQNLTRVSPASARLLARFLRPGFPAFIESIKRDNLSDAFTNENDDYKAEDPSILARALAIGWSSFVLTLRREMGSLEMLPILHPEVFWIYEEDEEEDDE